MAKVTDIRDIGVVGQEPTVINKVGDENIYLNKLTQWKAKSINKRTGNPLSIFKYPGERVLLMPNGSEKVIVWRGKRAVLIDYNKYKNSLIKTANIPKKLIDKIRAAEGQLVLPGLGVKQINYGEAKNFAEWFSKDIMGEQLSERNFWNKLGKLYQDYGFEPQTWYGKSSVGRDLSHFHPKVKGGRFTFVEHWLVNQSRGAKTFIGLDKLKQAQIPVTYEDLFEHYRKYVVGNEKPWYGSLNNLNIDDINALSRGDSVPEVVLRRQSINQLLTKAAGEGGDDFSLYHNEDYRRLIQTSRGIDYNTADNSYINLADDSKVAMKGSGKGSGFFPVEGSYEIPEGTTTKGYDVDIDTKGPQADITGSNKNIGKFGSGLTISSLVGDTAMSAINPETGYHAGVLASGEGDISNVKGAALGMGKDLAFGAGLKALTQTGMKHFASPRALGKKAIPYVGLPLLAYGAYDTADAFVKGLTNKGITERITEKYQQILDEEFDENKNWSDRHSEVPENFTTM